MSVVVRYYSRSGNTNALADTIASALSVDAMDIRPPAYRKSGYRFLGCSYCAFDIDEEVKQFLTNNKDYIGKRVCFGTSAMMHSVKKPLLRVTVPLGLSVAEEEFHCKGSFAVFHKGHPDAEDLANAAAFARAVSEICS